MIRNSLALLSTVAWAACPAAIDQSEMVVSKNAKFQVGSTFNVAGSVSLNDWTPLTSKAETSQAMLDLGFAYTPSSTQPPGNDNYDRNAKLDSTSGFCNQQTDSQYKIEIDFGGFFYVRELILMKRADGV